MKNFTWSLRSAALLLLLVQNALVLAAGPEVTGRSGDVTVSSSMTLLAIGDSVRTGSNGESTLQVNESGLRVSVSPDSEVSYQGTTAAGAQNFKVTKGRVHFSIVPGNHLDVETPHLVASVRGTEFSTTVDSQTSELSVSEGRVAVHDSKGVSGIVARGWSAIATTTGFTAQTNARLSMMSNPKAAGASVGDEDAKKAEGGKKSETTGAGAAESNGKSDAGGNTSNNNAGGNSSNNNAGGNSSNSNSGGNSSNNNSGGNSSNSNAGGNSSNSNTGGNSSNSNTGGHSGSKGKSK